MTVAAVCAVAAPVNRGRLHSPDSFDSEFHEVAIMLDSIIFALGAVVFACIALLGLYLGFKVFGIWFVVLPTLVSLGMSIVLGILKGLSRVI